MDECPHSVFALDVYLHLWRVLTVLIIKVSRIPLLAVLAALNRAYSNEISWNRLYKHSRLPKSLSLF